MKLEFLHEIGVRLDYITGGLAGGFVSAMMMRNVTPGQAIISATVGAFTANWLTDTVAQFSGTFIKPGGICFVVGLTAMVICQFFIEKMSGWIAARKNGGGHA